MSQRIAANTQAHTSFTSFHISDTLFKSQNNMLFKTQLSYSPQVQYFNFPKVLFLHLKRLMTNTNQLLNLHWTIQPSLLVFKLNSCSWKACLKHQQSLPEHASGR